MAVLAVAAIGSAAFSYAGIAWLGMSAAATGWVVGSLVGQYAFGSGTQGLQDQTTEGPRIDDVRISTSAYGVTRQIGYGTYPVGGNIIAASPTRETRHVHETDYETKGGNEHTVTNISYTYSIDLAVGLGRGIIDRVIRIYANEQLIFDTTSNSSEGTMPEWLNFTVYTGTEDQEPDPTLQIIYGEDTPAYRGEAYIVFTDFQLSDFGNAVPGFRFIVTKDAEYGVTPDVLEFQAHPQDSDPAYYSYYNGGNLLQLNNGLIYQSFDNGGAYGRYYIGGAFNPYTMEQVYLVAGGGYGHSSDLCGMSNPFAFVQSNSLIATLVDNGSFTSGFYQIINSNTGEVIHSQQYSDFLIGAVNLCTLYNERCVFVIFGSTYRIRIEVAVVPGLLGAPTIQASLPVPILDDDTFQYLSRTCVAVKRNSGGGFYAVYAYDPSWVEPRVFRFFNDEDVSYFDIPVPLFNDNVISPQESAANSSEGIVFFYAMTSAIDGHIPLIYGYDESGELVYFLNVSEVETPIQDVGHAETGFSYNEMTDLFTVSTSSHTLIINRTTQELVEILINQGGGRYELFHLPTYSLYQRGNAYRSPLNGTNPTVTRYNFAYDGNYALLSDIIADICDIAGYDESDYNVSDLTTTIVPGYRIARSGTPISFIKPLSIAYFFDIIDNASQLVFLRHGNGSTINIDEDELGCASIGSKNSHLELKKINREELPSKVSMTYINPDRHYENNTQAIERISSTHYSVNNLQISAVFTDDIASQITDSILHTLNYESEIYVINIPPTRLDIQCGDLISFSYSDYSYEGRVIEKSYVNGYIELKLIKYDYSLRTSTRTGATALLEQAAIPLLGQALIYILDIPALRSNENNDAGMYVAASSYVPNWPGGEIYSRPADGDFAFLQILSNSNIGHIYQYTQGTDIIANRWDNDTILEVTMLGGDLQTITEIQTLNNNNVAAWGNTGRWEIICFQNASLINDNTYRISKLLRGRRNTTRNIDLHTEGDVFVILNASMTFASLDIYNVGRTYDYVGVTFGTSLQATNDIVTHTNTGSTLIPFAPTHIETHASGNNLAGSWLYRSRYFTQTLWNPNNSDLQDFEIDIVDAGTVVRTITTTPSANNSVLDADEQTFLYDELDQIADGVGEVYDIYIYQLSAEVGRGYPGIISIDPIEVEGSGEITLDIEDTSFSLSSEEPIVIRDGELGVYDTAFTMASENVILTVPGGGGGGEGTFTGDGTSSSNIYTITGSGFGTRPNYGGTSEHLNNLWDTMESTDFLIPWTFTGSGNSWEKATSQTRARTRSAHKMDSTPLDRLENYLDGTNTHFYTSFWMHIPTNQSAGMNAKYARFGNNSDSYLGQNLVLHSLTSTSMLCTVEYAEDGGTQVSYGSQSLSEMKGAWSFVEIMWSLPHSGNTDDYALVYINGSLANELPRPDRNALWQQGAQMTQGSPPYWSYGTWYASAYSIGDGWFYEDIYQDHTLARVMLGNASTYAACTSFEAQVPLSWSNTEIQIRANQGPLSNGATAWLYVIDSSNNVVNSSGYQVTVGS